MPTALGGVLYLINLLAWLDLPGGWDSDGVLAEHLGGWAMVEALARGLLGEAHERHADDAIWPVLAELDGRPPYTALGFSLPSQSEFCLPVRWLRRFGPTEPRWVVGPDAHVGRPSGRLRVFDDASGYLIGELPATDSALARMLKTYQAAGCAPDWRLGLIPPLLPLEPGVAAAVSPAAGQWLVRVRVFVRWLLLGVLRERAEQGHDPAVSLLEAPGRLFVSRTHVDLTLPIERIRVPVRRAGLDCDPGWVPDLGRIVLFHFEEGTGA